MADRFILYQNGFYSLPNEVACCSRLTGDSLKLLGLITNRVNTAEKQGKELKTVAMSRLLLKRVFGNSVDKTVKNYAKRLKELGFIETYSLQGGDGGEFVFTINDRPVNNPYVLLSRIENELIALTELQTGLGADTLLDAFTSAIQDVEHDYVVRLKNAAENERQAILTEYSNYLRETLQCKGMASVGKCLPKSKNKKSSPLPKDTVLPEDVQSWSYPEFVNHFLQEYHRVTGKNHAAKSSKTGKTVEDCIKDLQHHYRDHENAERKPMMKRHIEAFFINYPPSEKISPTAFLMADCDALYNVQRYLETGSKHTPYEERSFKDRKGKSLEEIRAQQARETKQEYMGKSEDEFIERLISRKRRKL
ncbi:hypothetical protein P9314_03010 [Paenibacillus validus]|uniref:hypothetical protein n=1 Tax=Paenibacillus validus TaxID=44253 RepID=UPI000FD86440|nr:hypothetical protein [Paenibacillus validus]MED4599674.1 hypothetical protein [Paenibacillus validus]MED4604893.1 hypothetical protein [Paenibacillus validus]